jgi:hypothetical protein
MLALDACACTDPASGGVGLPLNRLAALLVDAKTGGGSAAPYAGE